MACGSGLTLRVFAPTLAVSTTAVGGGTTGAHETRRAYFILQSMVWLQHPDSSVLSAALLRECKHPVLPLSQLSRPPTSHLIPTESCNDLMFEGGGMSQCRLSFLSYMWPAVKPTIQHHRDYFPQQIPLQEVLSKIW